MAGRKYSIFRFADVEVYERELHLRRNGEVIPVEPKAFRVLLCLLRNPSRLIPKDELINAAWGDTAVTENSLTRNVALLRRLLEDDPRDPRYIETVTTVGYRFVCPVEVAEDSADEPAAKAQSPDENGGGTPLESRIAPTTGPIKRSPWLWAGVSAVVVAGAAVAIGWWRTPPEVPVVESVTQLTEDPQPKSNLLTDGSRIYFNEGPSFRNTRIAQVSVTGGPTVPLETRLANPYIAGAAHDGSWLLAWVYAHSKFGSLWSIPLPTGEPRRLANDVLAAALSTSEPRHLANDVLAAADVLPDGRLLLAVGKDVLIADSDGSNLRKLISFPGSVGWIDVSPADGRVLLSVDTNHGDNNFDWFEMAADGTDLREVRKANVNECCFYWSWNGKYLLYSGKTGTRWDLWALPVRGGLFHQSKDPIRLTNGPQSYPQGAIPSRDGKQIFAVAAKERGELVRYDLKSHQFVPLLSGISATDATYSQDGKWVAYTTYPDHNLWRSRDDGSDRMQLTYPPMAVSEPFISPDGTKVVFNSVTDSSICVIDMNGGPPRKIIEKGESARWSPDGKSIAAKVYGSDNSDLGIRIVEVGTGKIFEVPSSKGRGGAIWLGPETLGADEALKKLLIFDLKTKKWTDLVAGNFENWVSSPDGKYVYFAAGGAEPSVQRIRVADRHIETITSLKDFTRVINFGWTQLRVSPDGSPTLTRAVDSREIYALNVRWP